MVCSDRPFGLLRPAFELTSHVPFYRDLTGATLDVLLIHEIGHTPQASQAFGYRYTPYQKYSNEFDVIRNVENTYRSFRGIGLRKSYGKYPVPVNQPLE